MRVRGPCGVLGCPNKGTHTFPQNEVIKQKWIKVMKLDRQRKLGWNLCKYSSICSEHFKESDFIPLTSSCGVRKTRRLKNNAIPSIFPWTSLDEGETSSISSYHLKRVTKTYSRPILPTAFAEEILFKESTPYDIDSDSHDEIPTDPLEITVDNDDNMLENDEDVIVSTYSGEVNEFNSTHQFANTEICPEDFEYEQEASKSEKCTQTDSNINPPFSIHTYKHDNKAMHFYAGLETFGRVLFVFETLGEQAFHLNYFYGSPPNNVLPLDQFFITFIILRTHKTFEEMSMMYLIPIKQIYNIFVTWVRFMALQWRSIDLWIDREMVHTYVPLDFYDKYPMTRVVLDATEFPIKKPSLPLAQQITFSSYKNRNTVKVLIGITPSGLINYVSPCYGGSATDIQIIERSTILNRFDFKDEIMVDKGLNIQDILLGYGVKVNMPTFKKNQVK